MSVSSQWSHRSCILVIGILISTVFLLNCSEGGQCLLLLFYIYGYETGECEEKGNAQM